MKLKFKFKKKLTKDISIEELRKNRKWKEENKKYLLELQRFFDKVDNVLDRDLRDSIVSQMLRCDNVLTEIAEQKFIEYYEEGIEKSKD